MTSVILLSPTPLSYSHLHPLLVPRSPSPAPTCRTSLKTWPKARSTDYFLQADGSITSAKSTSSTASRSYLYDPSHPQVTNGGNNLPPDIGGSIECGPLDQSEIDKRSDVLVFQTEVLTDALPLTGPLYSTLYVSSDAIDTDFMVRISDVYPTGEVRLLQDNAVRMRWREQTLTPVYMEKDQVYEINLNLWNTSYVFAAGHSLRVAISSSNNPRYA